MVTCWLTCSGLWALPTLLTHTKTIPAEAPLCHPATGKQSHQHLDWDPFPFLSLSSSRRSNGYLFSEVHWHPRKHPRAHLTILCQSATEGLSEILSNLPEAQLTSPSGTEWRLAEQSQGHRTALPFWARRNLPRTSQVSEKQIDQAASSLENTSPNLSTASKVHNKILGTILIAVEFSGGLSVVNKLGQSIPRKVL